MKFKIPEEIKNKIDKITSILFFYKEDDQLNTINVLIPHARACPFLKVNIKNFDNITDVWYEITFNNNIKEILKFNNRHSAVHKSLSQQALVCLRTQTSSLYEDTDQERLRCLEDVDEKIQEAESIIDEIRGTKNLIYYTIYFDNGYCDLLNKSIETLLKHNKKRNFDVLLITDEQTKNIIEQLPFNSKIKPLFHITETPLDGVEASKQKTKIFDFKYINQYKKVLFVDCDVVFIKDVKNIFDLELQSNILHTAYNSNLNVSHYKTVHHGFLMLPESFVEEMRIAKQIPFNAGQFLFINSTKMEAHFHNVNWFMKNWSGEYFFEQCFMNYYFGKAYLGNTLLNKYAAIVSTTDQKLQIALQEKAVFVHFIAPPLNAKAKLDFINTFEINKKTTKSNFFKKLFKLL